MKPTTKKPIESALRTFCESQHRLLIVIAVTFVIGLVTLWPLVDDYFAGKNERAEITEELRSARLDEAAIDQLEEKVGDLTAQLEAIDSRTVSQTNVSTFRSQLVELARASGCQVRRITVGALQSRPWRKGDRPLKGRADGSDSKTDSNLTLEKQPLSLSVSGTVIGLKTLLERMRDEGTLVHVKSLDIRPTAQSRKNVILDLELWFFQLTAAAAAS